MNCQFSFGPNRSYFVTAGSVFAWSDDTLPPDLVRILEDEDLDCPYDVGLPMEPEHYTISWRTTSGEDWYEDERLGPNYTRLARFIQIAATAGSHTTLTTFGPNHSFFSLTPTGYSWQNIPPCLEEDIQRCLQVRRPSAVALGVQRTFIVIYSDGGLKYELGGEYPLVELIFRNEEETKRRGGVAYVALNPFIAGEFYLVYGDGRTLWNFPPEWSEDVAAVSTAIRPRPSRGEKIKMKAPSSEPEPTVCVLQQSDTEPSEMEKEVEEGEVLDITLQPT
ncbi:hypothetical protein FB45DRAFT_1038360 [Roridomyces roridus]|uniref:Uncharacterized protein n=1 Tax=Roridomyces roridus TaxID=1738132 RepID=A0AAD7B3U5_9AGAR|nr:hypothetical protein FB45DRAFT_1038360 [Roridomyces roridus]